LIRWYYSARDPETDLSVASLSAKQPVVTCTLPETPLDSVNTNVYSRSIMISSTLQPLRVWLPLLRVPHIPQPLSEVIKMHHLAESAVDIPFSIGPKTWFYRHSFDHVTKTLIVSSIPFDTYSLYY
jgi:hypothetical protein